MDMLDQALDGSQDKTNDSTGSDDHVQLTHHTEDGVEDHTHTITSVTSAQGTLSLDPNIQYQFRADTGQGPVTYRVVQVATQDGTEATQVVSTAAFPAGAQAVIQSPYNGGSPTPDNQPDTRFTYFPAVSVGGGDVNSQGTDVAGQFYVMMSPQDVLQGQRSIAPRTGFSPKVDGRTGRDDRRRATHNEVERRRRDKINNWIVQLSKLVPECSQEHTKQGQIGSKGGILAKACEYITELRNANARMAETLKETERLSVDVELLRQQCEELKNENSILRSTIQQHGIVPPDLSGGAS
ncbi:hypothetical protein CHS0354_040448 [Potamilus streckersoni]|uniref:BHLH domain-containing protein n=1 Tax=Potamilus streckersoni TaxID=2493646 RepID=A0AAE0T125_9BIVA|nr:hypothetical protein CHS0354_040448 [Potamilus streckersoni]